MGDQPPPPPAAAPPPLPQSVPPPLPFGASSPGGTFIPPPADTPPSDPGVGVAAAVVENLDSPKVIPPPADPPQIPEEKLQKMEKKRKAIIAEIVSTERSYQQGLETAIGVVLLPLKSIVENPISEDEKPFITMPELLAIFSNMELILSTNKEFLNTLEPISENWTPDAMVGPVFSRFSPFFKMYTQYCNNFDNSRETLTRLTTENKQFADFLASFQTPLPSLLITPIQRIPRYKLLLEDLLKNTPPGHADHDTLIAALSAISTTATAVNESIRRQENMAQMMKIQKSFAGNMVDTVGTKEGLTGRVTNLLGKVTAMQNVQLIEPHRQYVRDGPISKLCRKGPKRFWFFLFNDVLVYGEPVPGTEKFIYHRTLELATTRLDRNGPEAIKHSFNIISLQKSFTAICADDTEKDQWVNSIMECIEAQRQKNAARTSQMVKGSAEEREAKRKSNGDFSAPVWVSDKNAKSCMNPLCKNPKFTLVNRRHHCRVCGKVFCSDCSSQKLTIPGQNKPVRACDECFFSQDPDKHAQIKKHEGMMPLTPKSGEMGMDSDDEDDAAPSGAGGNPSVRGDIMGKALKKASGLDEQGPPPPKVQEGASLPVPNPAVVTPANDFAASLARAAANKAEQRASGTFLPAQIPPQPAPTAPPPVPQQAWSAVPNQPPPPPPMSTAPPPLPSVATPTQDVPPPLPTSAAPPLPPKPQVLGGVPLTVPPPPPRDEGPPPPPPAAFDQPPPPPPAAATSISEQPPPPPRPASMEAPAQPPPPPPAANEPPPPPPPAVDQPPPPPPPTSAPPSVSPAASSVRASVRFGSDVQERIIDDFGDQDDDYDSDMSDMEGLMEVIAPAVQKEDQANQSTTDMGFAAAISEAAHVAAKADDSNVSKSYWSKELLTKLNTRMSKIDTGEKATSPRRSTVASLGGASFDGYFGAEMNSTPWGAKVVSIEDDSPAHAAGLVVGDVIFQWSRGNDNTIPGTEICDLVESKAIFLRGAKVDLTVKRAGKFQRFEVTIE